MDSAEILWAMPRQVLGSMSGDMSQQAAIRVSLSSLSSLEMKDLHNEDTLE